MRIFTYVTIFCLSHCAVAQTSYKRAHRKMVKQLFKALDYEDYVEADELTDTLIKLFPDNPDIKYAKGRCFLKTKNQEDSAYFYFSTITNKNKYDDFNYYLANSFIWHNEFDKAISAAQASLEEEHINVDADTKLELLNQCYESKEMVKAKSPHWIRNLSLINTPFQESVPVVEPNNEQFMFFTSRRPNRQFKEVDHNGDYFQDIYFAKMGKSQFYAPIFLGLLNEPLHDAAVSISHDGSQFIYFKTDSNNFANGDLYVAMIDSSGNIMSNKKLPSQINSPYVESSACFSNDGEILYFSSNRPGGYGGFDLYFCRKLPNGQWAKEQNLGPIINTKSNEDGPNISADGMTLFFCSDGHKGMGGFDIFKSKLDIDGSIGLPENMGYPINSIYHDMYFQSCADYHNAYFSSGRKGGIGGDDLYKVHIREPSDLLKIIPLYLNDNDGNNIKGQILLLNLDSKKLVGDYSTNSKNGKAVLYFNPELNYQLLIRAEGYHNKTLNFNGKYVSLDDLDELKIELKKLNP